MNETNRSVRQKLFIVMGVSGSGKTTIAKQLSILIDGTFLDADDFHSKNAKLKMASGVALEDADREPWVASIIRGVESAEKVKPIVLAFSGLKHYHRDKFRAMRLDCHFIFLDAPYSVLKQRIGNRHNHFFDPTLLVSQFAELERPKLEGDVLYVDVSSTVEAILLKIESWIRQIYRPCASMENN